MACLNLFLPALEDICLDPNVFEHLDLYEVILRTIDEKFLAPATPSACPSLQTARDLWCSVNGELDKIAAQLKEYTLLGDPDEAGHETPRQQPAGRRTGSDRARRS